MYYYSSEPVKKDSPMCQFLLAGSVFSFFLVGLMHSKAPLFLESHPLGTLLAPAFSQASHNPDVVMISSIYCMITLLASIGYLKTRSHRYAQDIRKICIGWATFGLLCSLPAAASVLFGGRVFH